ncbi:BQ5605_C048g12372 [Microbotryum silenes-dioicae]|uniref:BQ5605_C048g12372 protein n=1 Tax=Microbotryum silenes-dioicae TaxID=796604 RepID=A0A2X0MPK4_9BASI|nr:BQ5605_C048g12372 [Microbotryum silenes-dioicae]
MSTDDNKTKLYHYDPSFGLAIAATAIFGAVFVGHVFLMMRHKAWYMAPFVVGVFGECAGYAVRRISAAKPHNTMLYIIQEMFIILAPACMAASHYMCFGRLITYVGEKYSPVRARRVTAVFVTFDVASFCIQGGGGALYSGNNTKNFRLAKAVLTVGFLIQIISFGIFAIFAIIYQTRARRAGEPAGMWTRCLYTLYIGTVLILIRGIYRTVSFASGDVTTGGYLLSHEGWYYGLETLPILLCTIFFLISYPGKLISSDRSLRLHPEQASGVHLGTYASAASAGSDEEKGGMFSGRFRRNY